MELNRDLIKKELVLLIDDMPVELHLHSKKTSKFLSFLKSVLTIITTDEQKIKDLEMEKTQLERNLSECEVGYEGTLFLDRAKLHDAEQKIKEQQAEIEKYKKLADLNEQDNKDTCELLFKEEDKNKELQAHNENLQKENKYLRERLAEEMEHKEDMEGKK